MLKVRSYVVLPVLPEPLKELDFIARNLFWVWNHEFVELFRRIDNNLWETCGHCPVKLLACVSQERLDHLAADEGFACELDQLSQKLRSYLNGPRWFEKVTGQKDEPVIAYFSAEFGLHECLPMYAGGLGMLAGDHLKSASDLGLPLVGVGLLYQKGYFRQYLNADGWQQEVYVENDFNNMALEPVRKKNGQPLTISVQYPGRCVSAQIWCVSVGRVKLYLLDCNIPTNSQMDRLITANLYSADREMRICQEIMLGIGGLKALKALGIKPTVCHMNEGHSAFMALERIRQLQSENKMSFAEAVEATRVGNVFTAHTPVKAGLEEFPTEVMDKYFGNYFPSLGINRKEFFGLGRFCPDDEQESFKMPILALRLSSFRNGVSSLHGQVARQMWSCIWAGLPVDEVPIKSITNGVHTESWLSDEMNGLYERYLGPGWQMQVADKSTWDNIDRIPDSELWGTHLRSKEHLVAFARSRLKTQMQRRGSYHTELNRAEEVLDPEVLTIGFARRFAAYKRGSLLLRDPQRLVRLLTDDKRPIQVVFAGKAHPSDKQGKEIIRHIVNFAAQYHVRRRIVFLEDYDINVAKILVRGVDLWLNTPRRPMEASGTSGMKAAVNGALNMSTLDGWWCEGYQPETGWVIGTSDSYADSEYQDMVESRMLYNILENEVIPLFYTHSADGLPKAWIRRVKNSIKWIGPRFNTHRMVDEYASCFYNPAVAKWRYMNADQCAAGKALSAWMSNIRNCWSQIAIDDVQVCLEEQAGVVERSTTQPQPRVGSNLQVTASLRLGAVTAQDVSVQLYCGPLDGWGNFKNGSAVEMHCDGSDEQDQLQQFVGSIRCASSGRWGLAVRVLPKHSDLSDPCEPGLILWESTQTESPVAIG